MHKSRVLTVSVITPCYNGGKYLRETIESVLAQTHRVLEMIVVDDGSTDDSAAIAQSFGPPVRVIRQTNQGESVARNSGIAEARGSYLLFLDADDLLHPGALGQLLAGLARMNDRDAVGLMAYGRFTTNPNEIVVAEQPQLAGFFPAIVAGTPGVPHCFLTPAHLVRRVGGFCEDLRYSEDWDFWCRIALTGASLCHIPFVGAFYRLHAGGQQHNAKLSDRKLGHVAVIERLINGLLHDRPMLELHGESAFWAGWTAVRTARDLGIRWSQLDGLTAAMENLVRNAPHSLQQSRLVWLSKYIGIRSGLFCESLWSRRIQPPAPNVDKRLVLPVSS